MEWLDEMVTKLQAELERQLLAVSEAKTGENDSRSRAADARTLSALERTLERLSRLEQERAAARERKVVRHGAESARAALARKLDKLAGPQKPRKPAGKS